MPRKPTKYIVKLTEEQCSELLCLVNKGEHNARIIKRENIIMLSDQGKTAPEIAENRVDFAGCMKTMGDEWFPEADEICVVLDQLNTHTPGSFYKAFASAEAERLTEKLKFHYTPTHGSWLSMAEIELSVLSRQHLKQRIPMKEKLQEISSSWASKRTDTKAMIDWRFSVRDAREKFSKFYHNP